MSIRPASVNIRCPARAARELAIVFGWLAATGFAFWWHASTGLNPEGGRVALATFVAPGDRDVGRWLSAHSAAPTGRHTTVTLLHLRRPDCGCNGRADARIEALRRQYATRGMRVETITVDPATQDAPDWLAATPAAALLDARGNVVYLGPVEDTAFCSATAGAPVQRALEAALAGSPLHARSILATGCFCT